MNDTTLITGPSQPTALSLENMGTLMQLAVEKGIDLTELVNLHERLRKSQAEEAFNAAFAQFQATVPAIPHNKTGGGGKYTYADLEKITTTIQPTLDACGLTYDWDSQLEDKRLKVTCTVTHIAGHSRSRSFEATITSGTSAMNDIQKSASTITYGQRYSLRLALGISTGETDDDGRRAPTSAPEYDNPEPDPSAPRAPTRQQRQQQREGGQIKPSMRDRIIAVLTYWRGTRPDIEDLAKDPAEGKRIFANWTQGVSGCKTLDPDKSSKWTPVEREAFERVEQFIKEQGNG